MIRKKNSRKVLGGKVFQSHGNDRYWLSLGFFWKRKRASVAGT